MELQKKLKSQCYYTKGTDRAAHHKKGTQVHGRHSLSEMLFFPLPQ
jgi:hypothetical protein